MISGPDDIAFVEAPKERKLKRSNTVPKKPEGGGGLMGLFGSLRRNTRPEIPERRKSRSQRDEDGRHADLEREESRRLRRDERKRRSMRPDTDGEGFTTDPGPAAAPDTEAEDPEAKNAARKARRASRQAPADELREAEERRARRKEKERAREMRERQAREEEEERRREEKRARRAAREERRAREEQEAREADARAAERRERRRLREQETYEAARARRRHSRAGERPFERSADDGEKSKRRKSKIPPEASKAPPVISGNKHEKISSWVNSQADDPPEPPPVTPTVLDVPPPPGEPLNVHSVSSDDEARRDLRRRARRRAKHPGLTDEEIDDLRARRRRSERDGIKSSSGSGDYDRERGYAPPLGPKVPNWFRKLTSR